MKVTSTTNQQRHRKIVELSFDSGLIGFRSRFNNGLTAIRLRGCFKRDCLSHATLNDPPNPLFKGGTGKSGELDSKFPFLIQSPPF
jgi:hypothetical protein